MEKAIECNNVSFKYPGYKEKVLKNINLQVPMGETIVIAGSSGSGKTTLLRCLCGIIPHRQNGTLQGVIKIMGKNTQKASFTDIISMVGMVFQEPECQLFSPTVETELAFGPENLCLPRREIIDRVDWVCELLGLNEIRFSHPYTLSGGQKQLVAFASVLTLKPKILLLDEVTSSLDEGAVKRVISVLKEFKNEGSTIISVDHTLSTVTVADSIYILNNGMLGHFDGREELV